MPRQCTTRGAFVRLSQTWQPLKIQLLGSLFGGSIARHMMADTGHRKLM